MEVLLEEPETGIELTDEAAEVKEDPPKCDFYTVQSDGAG